MSAWFCPTCGTRLSYGVYCKTCKAETTFAYRPLSELDRLIEQCKRWPAPEFPRFADDQTWTLDV